MPSPASPKAQKLWDVLVAGGGTAGLAAAISAARAGASVLLVERSDVLGGNATQAFVHSFCGLFLPPENQEYQYANPGFAERLAQWLVFRGAALPPETHGKVGVLPTFPEKMAPLFEEATAAVSGLAVACSTGLREICDGGNKEFFCVLGGVATEAETGCRARFIIDTSGDAHAAVAAGVPTEVSAPEELQHPTFVFRISGANPKDLTGYQRLKLAAVFNRAARSGLLPPECDSVLVRPGGTPGEAFLSLNMPKPAHGIYDPLDGACIRNMEEMARQRAAVLVRFLRQEVPGWEACDVLEWPRRMGIRETRRIQGLYVMTAKDVLEGRHFEDQVAWSTWPIELWNKHTGAEFYYPAAPCGIPLRALMSAGHPRLGMAGRCVSATHEALGALRVMGTAMAAGEAIGIAAALAATKDCNLPEIQASEVREIRSSVHLKAKEQP
ncbi:MAG TPA: FAD-dependent oxidoreductase [Candidatus Methylacidiphilales bacterium]|nr:FAD-dependent oxidoreductase [Candidatus Methylacidiphilales bacterium]